LHTLRSRMIFSHILPILIIVPLMYIAMVYLLETQLFIPKLTEDLRGNVRIITEMSRTETFAPGNYRGIVYAIQKMELDPDLRVIYMQPDGTMIYTNDPSYSNQIQKQLDVPALARLQSGNEVVITNYSFIERRKDFLQVLQPISSSGSDVAGILWVSYYDSMLNNLFKDLRLLSLAVMFGFLLLGSILGSILALSISKPLTQATQTIQQLAHGEGNLQLKEKGPKEVRELAQAVNFLVERMVTLEQARRQLLANLVHELGRPLGALRSGIQALSKGAGKDPLFMKDLTSGMDEETARLQKVLDELAHLHDQVLGPLELNLEQTKIDEWLPKVLIPWKEAATQKRINWETDIPSDIPNVNIDRMRMSQVIGNLVSNAVKYTPPGRKVHVKVGHTDQQIWIKVSDTGPGISKQEQDKIFEPFYRGDQGRRIKQGMGLGLSIARDLTVAHGGHLKLESSPDQGSSFIVWLPV